MLSGQKTNSMTQSLQYLLTSRSVWKQPIKLLVSSLKSSLAKLHEECDAETRLATPQNLATGQLSVLHCGVQ